ncbi:MAG: hypothetical protein ACREEK_34940 [Bradyrhizobium sp.]
MQVGDIFLWNTDQAAGHAARDKYHVYICESDWRVGHTFLFISKANYGCDYEILKSDYTFFPLDRSYISCTGIIHYDDAELAAFPQQALGRLSRKHLLELSAAIQAGGAMVEWEMQRVCNAIAAG